MRTQLVLFINLLFFTALLHAQTLLWTQVAHPDSLQVNGVDFSVDGTKVLSATECHPAHIRLFDTNTGNLVWNYTAPGNLMCMMGANFSANGTYFATVEEMGNILLFNQSQNPPVLTTTIDMGTDYAFSICFSPNSDKLAVGGSNSKLQTYNLPSGSVDLNIVAHTGWVTSVTYSPDNQLIATGGSDDKVKIWNTTGQLQKILTGHTGDITALKFTPDNSKLISSSKDNKLKIWDVATGTLLNTLSISASAVNAFDMSENGDYLVTVSDDEYIRVWNTNDYSLNIEFLQAHNALPKAVSWLANSNIIATGTSKGLITAYQIDGITGIENDWDASQISISPCPFDQYIQVKSLETSIKSIELIDAMGKNVLTEEFNAYQKNYQINTSSLTPSATYIILIETEDGKTYTKTLIK